MTDYANARPPGGEADRWNGRVWALAGPIILSNLSTPLLGAVDTAVVGHLPDPAYIGAVAIGAVIFNFLFWGFGFLRMGTTGFAAQAFGAGNPAEVRATLARPLLLALALGTLVLLLQAPVGLIAFSLLEASAEVEGFSRSYYEIRIWSAPAALMNYAMLGWLLGVRQAKAVLLLQVAMNAINIVLDLVFVVGFGWDIEGVAYASVIAEYSAVVLGLAIVGQHLRALGGTWDPARVLDRGRLVALFKVNADILVRTLCLIAAFAYLTARGAEMGDLVLAGNAILMQLQGFLAHGLDGFAHAASILAGNALGARSRPAFRAAVKTSTLWALGLAALFTAVYGLLGPGIVALFTNIAEVRETANAYLPWMALSPLISIWGFQLDGIFIGATRTADMRNAMLASLAVLLVACWLLIPPLGNHGLWLAFTIFTVARGITLGLYYPRLERSVGQA